MGFRTDLQAAHDAVSSLEVAARALENKNLADVIHDGLAKLEQALMHPDVDKVGADTAPTFNFTPQQAAQ